MLSFLPKFFDLIKFKKKLISFLETTETKLKFIKEKRYFSLVTIEIILLVALIIVGTRSVDTLISPFTSLKPIKESKSEYEVFGFAPYWTFDKLDNVDFNVLTTFAYFGIPVDDYGNLDTTDPGFHTFQSTKATEVFKKAHRHGTRVVLTLTQMENQPIINILDNPSASENAINQSVALVKERGIDGVNVDFEYTGNPGEYYRQRFTEFVGNLTQRMHREVPQSKVTVSVYAGSAKDPKLYDVSTLAKNSDGIFMMAYDFAVSGSDQAMPTAPLYGYKEGFYWYDVSTAVEDFLAVMPPTKLILGVPWYAYNYLVYEPLVKSSTWGNTVTQTYSIITNNIHPNMSGIIDYKAGWDEAGKVSWKAYQRADTGAWRMVFSDDVKSLSEKYDFVKQKKLLGVGMWALGFDDGKSELWSLLENKFGKKLAKKVNQVKEIINENI